MPELPEVHTTVEGLKTVVLNRTIKDVWSDFHIGSTHKNNKTIKNKKYFEFFKKKVIGQKIKSLDRKGKYILINLSGDQTEEQTIIVHMKMTGCLMYKKNLDEKYTHLVFTLDKSDYLILSDLRKFASVSLIPSTKILSHPNIGKLGPDPLDPKFNSQKLYDIIHRQKNVPIKSALLNQNALAGIGNIYSDEILWKTGIHPLSLADRIPLKKFGEIFRVMQKILKFSIKHGGDSKSDYRNAFGEKGGFQNFHKVYGKKKEKCQRKGCGGIIERLVVRGRSAHFCPKHQKIYK